MKDWNNTSSSFLAGLCRYELGEYLKLTPAQSGQK